MRLINYYRGASTAFDCVIHGTIKMTPKEWHYAYLYLSHNRKHLDPYGGTFMWDILKQDIRRRIETKKGFYINIRVTATELLTSKYRLTNYKRGNYQIFVSK